MARRGGTYGSRMQLAALSKPRLRARMCVCVCVCVCVLFAEISPRVEFVTVVCGLFRGTRFFGRFVTPASNEESEG